MGAESQTPVHAPMSELPSVDTTASVKEPDGGERRNGWREERERQKPRTHFAACDRLLLISDLPFEIGDTRHPSYVMDRGAHGTILSLMDGRLSLKT